MLACIIITAIVLLTLLDCLNNSLAASTSYTLLPTDIARRADLNASEVGVAFGTALRHGTLH